MARLLRSANAASTYDEGDGMQIFEVFTEDDLRKAEEDGAFVFLYDDETGAPGRTLFDGERWLVERPVHEASDDLVVVTPTYVDERTEVVQSELEALVDVIAEAVPARAIATLRNRVASARIAMRDGNSVAMARVAETLSDTREATIFTVERAEEVANAGKTDRTVQ